MKTTTEGKEETNVQEEQIRRSLSDSGCQENVAGEILWMWKAGEREEALWLIKKDRCRLLEELHCKSRRLDKTGCDPPGREALVRRKEGQPVE